jgi:hypothetical protein
MGMMLKIGPMLRLRRIATGRGRLSLMLLPTGSLFSIRVSDIPLRSRPVGANPGVNSPAGRAFRLKPQEKALGTFPLPYPLGLGARQRR